MSTSGPPSALARRLWLPSIPVLIGILVLGCVMLTPGTLSNFISRAGDAALHMTLGRLMVEQGGLLAEEPTSLGSEPGQAFIAHEWLTQLLYGWTHAWAGPFGPTTLTALMFALVMALLTRVYVTTRVEPWIAGAFLAYVFFILMGRLGARPFVFTWLFALILLVELEAWSRRRASMRRLASIAIPLCVLWANLHGGFLLAFVLIGVYVVGAFIDRTRGTPGAAPSPFPLIGLGFACLAATLVNPFGWRLHAHLIQFLLDPVLTTATYEFLPLPLLGEGGVLLLLPLLGLGIVLARRGKAVRATHLVLLVVLTVMAMRSTRHLAILCLLAPPVILAGAPRVPRPDAGQCGLLTALGCALLFGLAVLLPPGEAVTFQARTQPVHAVEHLRQIGPEETGSVFARYAWGGYIVYELYPPTRVFLHGFNDHYGAEHLARYDTVKRVEAGWSEMLDRYDIRTCVVPVKWDIAHALAKHEGWRETYRDELAVVFRRAN